MSKKTMVYAHGLYAVIILPFVLLIALRVGLPECLASEEPAESNSEASAESEPENVTSTEEVEVVAESAKVKVDDEVIASIKKGERFAVNRRQGPWVGIVVESAGEERLGWVLANRVQTVVEAGGGESSTAPGPPEFLRVSVDSTQLSDSKSQRQMRRPDGTTYAMTASVKALYCRLSVNNQDINAVRYDASQFALQVDGQTLRHVACKSRSYSEKIYSAGNATAPRDPAELEYLQTGQISAGGSVDGWLRFELPSVREVRDLAKKTWRLSGKIGNRTFSVDLREAEVKALAAKVRPSTVDASVQVVEIGGARINALNAGKLLDLIEPLVAKGEGVVVTMTDEHCIVDSLASKEVLRPMGNRRENLLVWAGFPQALRERLRLDSIEIRSANRSISYPGASSFARDRDFRQLVLLAGRLRVKPSELMAALKKPVAQSETSAVIWVLGKRPGTEKTLVTHLANPESGARVVAAWALGTHTAEAGVVDALVKAATDEDAGTRSEAVFSLANSEDPKATQAIQRAMSDAEARVRCAAALAADSDRGEKTVESLIGLLRDPEVSVVMAACASLGTLKAEKAVEALKELQSAEETHVAAAAIDALKAIGTLATLEAARAKLGIVQLLADELDALAKAKDKADVPKLISVMQSVRKENRYYSDQLVKVLSDIGDPQAVEPLIGLLRQGAGIPEYSLLDENPLPMALGRLGDKRAAKPLEEALASVKGSQRHPFYVALLMLEASGALDRVSAEIKKNSNNYDLRKLLEILAQSGHPQAVPLIEPALDSRQHHRSATLSLLHIGTPAAFEAIKSRLLARDYPHAQAVVSEVGSRLVAIPMTAQQIRELLEQRLSLLGELADSPNSVVQENVPRYVASLEQSLVAGDLKTFLAHVSAKEFDAADKAFQEFITKYVAAVGKTPSQAGYITRGFSTMQSAYARAEQAERAEKHFAKAISAIEEIAKKPDAPNLSGLLIDLRGIKVVSALSADRQVKEEEIRQLINDLKTHLSGKAAEELTTTDLKTAVALAGALERASHTDLAQETYEILAKTAGQSKKESLVRAADSYATKARRLGLIGKEMEISGPTLDGDPFDWSSYRGKVVLIDFWTSWCPHCWPEIANARKAYELYHDQGFDVVGINLDEDTNKMNAYLKKENLPWTILHTKGAGWKHPMAVEYGIRAVPTMFLVDRNGKVVSVNVRGSKLQDLLNALIGPPDPNRQAVQWALAADGKVNIRIGGTVRAVKSVADLPNKDFAIVALNFWCNRKVTANGLRHLQKLPQLETFKLVQNYRFTDADLENFAGLKKLRFLDLQCNRLDGTGLAHLAALENIEMLQLHQNRLKDENLCHLARLTSLKHLNVGYSPVTSEGLKHLKNLKNLQHLQLYNTHVDDRWSENLGVLPVLEKLHLGQTPVADSGLKGLGRYEKLSSLWLDGTLVTDAGLEHLKELATLKTLDLSKTHVTADGVARLRASLPDCRIRWTPPDNVADLAVSSTSDGEAKGRVSPEGVCWLKIVGRKVDYSGLRISANGVESIYNRHEKPTFEINGHAWNPEQRRVLVNDGKTRLYAPDVDFAGAEVYAKKVGRWGNVRYRFEKDALQIHFVHQPAGATDYELVVRLPVRPSAPGFEREPAWTSPWLVKCYAYEEDASGAPPDVAVVEAQAPVATKEVETLDWIWWDHRSLPLKGMPKDYVVVTAERTFQAEAGEYRLETFSDDGIRVFVDGKKILANWTDHATAQDFCMFPLSAGEHKMRVEYFEGKVLSRLGVWLRRMH